MLGETIKGYRITERLGKGAMGEVWMAEQPIVSNIKVAIKVLLPEWSNDEVIFHRFFDEARAASQIKHAGIAKIHDVGTHNGRAFLIMELLEGETLAARLGRVGRLPLGLVGEFGKQIASALKATHAVNIIHRDLKPDNIFLVQDDEAPSGERAKVLDFGIAKLSSSVGLTTAGKPMGTPGYMGPELWSNAAQADARTDVYSLGCIAFEMCCGRPPFEVCSHQDAYYQHTQVTPPRARSLVQEVPAALDEIIARALAKDPAERPSVRDLHRAFAAVTAAYPIARTESQPSMPSRPQVVSPPRRSWLVAIGAGAVVGLAAGGYAVAQLGTDLPHPTLATPTPPPGAPAEARREASVNAWVRVSVPVPPVVLGIRSDGAPSSIRGFRPARKIVSPKDPYDLQEHEVTWSEIEPWLARTGRSLVLPTWAAEPAARGSLPVTGVTWSVARAYCESLAGSLPTEEQWEYAARGPELRPNSWGSARLDRDLTRVYAGPAAIPAAVKTSVQDRTPGPVLYDLTGNVQEWTLGLWRDDLPDTDEAWVTPGTETSIRAVRGLPLGAERPPEIQDEGAAYRAELCATGKCVEKTLEKLRHVGFRCARPAG